MNTNRMAALILALLLTLTASCSPAENVQELSGMPAAATPAPDASSAPQRNESACSYCDDGFYRTCSGIDPSDCIFCDGTGFCPVCFGRGQLRIPGYEGAGTASYATCSGCEGSGRCPYCHGDYFTEQGNDLNALQIIPPRILPSAYSP